MLRWWTRVAGVRVRTTAAAVLVVGLAMTVGGVALVLALRTTLLDGARSTAEVRAASVAASLAAGADPVQAVTPQREGDDLVVQVVDRSGRVVAASPLGRSLPALRPAGAEGAAVVDDLPGGGELDDELLVVAVPATADGSAATVLVGREVDDILASTRLVTVLLAAGGPLLVVVVGATTWVLVGRALAPVTAIRREADAIGDDRLQRRVPVPATTDEVARLATTVNRMLDRLQAGRQRQQRFVADAAHELRSPVASLRQHAEVAHTYPGRTSAEELGRDVAEEARRLQRLVDDLLLLARADESAAGTSLAVVDLDDVVLAEAARARASSGVVFDVSEVSAGRVQGDEDALRRVVGNLLDNAVRNTGTTVRPALREESDEVVLVVDDDGPGVPAGDRERVFERFVRLDAGRGRAAGGTGLGLAIVRQVVTSHGGSVRLGTSPLGGARVEVRLPAVVEP
ncbi:ATP-binding protein [Aquipuribacter nitratireducens]|uniref:histidine kinase n=1 Tax=Aquipuribacter nitratireducens TaxID=650104 RepID=A0ABW0GQR6_9MICO